MELAQAGAHVICTARSTRGHSTQSKLPATTIDDTVDAIHEARGRAEAIVCDHTDHASVKALVEYIAKQYSRLDILVNNAWGGYYIMTILAQENPTIKAINPRTWIKNTDYLEQEFQPSLRAFSKHRRRLLALLEPLPPKDWIRTNTLIGAGKPLQQTLMSHADGLARHERTHLKQIERILNALQSAT